MYIKETTVAALVTDRMKPAMGRDKVRTTPGSLTLQLFMFVPLTKEVKRKTWFLCCVPVTEVGFFSSKRKLSMDDIRNLYGSTEVQTEGRKQLKQA